MSTSSYHGLLVVDKPGGMTSRDVVNRVQRWFPRGTKIGHTGTLDPLATGVLVVCVGQATRLAEYVQRMEKVYRAGLLLGATSDTDDADGAIQQTRDVQPFDRETIARCLQGFIGEIEQVPPAYSAAKVAGRRAYDLSRRGQEVALQPRRVHIHTLDILAYDYPRLELEVRCGKGTYIRSLARDLGERLGCGAFVEVLRRTRVGIFEADRAVDLDIHAATARSRLLPVSAAVAELAKMTLDAHDIARLRQGQSIEVGVSSDVLALPGQGDEVAVLDKQGVLAAVAISDRVQHLLRPEKVLPKT